MKKILFVVPHRPNRSPSQRFRFEQYLDIFKQNNYTFRWSYLVLEKHDINFYSKGNFFTKTRVIVKSSLKRLRDAFIADTFDIIFIQREAFFLGSSIFENLLSKSKAKIIYDFDDAIWLPNVSEANRKLEWLKNYKKTERIISYADVVIAGNFFLADYALQYNKNVKIIPTTIDTEYHIPLNSTSKNDKICIGWTGTHSTIQHFELIIPILKKLKKKFGNKIYFKIIGDSNYISRELQLRGKKWQKETEIEDLQEIDIGIMPLPDNEWAKGKCGFKGLQYMALEIPAILSPVGVNTKIITDNVNGFLADTEEEWFEKLSVLIENKELREKLGKAGRQTVIERYSVESQKGNYLKCFEEVLKI